MYKTGVGADKTCIKNMSFCAFGNGANSSVVDIKDGKILRTRPLDFNMNCDREQRKPWKVEKDGKVFNAAEKSEIPPFAFVYKKRVTSSNRIQYPMKREDWDPNGERNPQNRGKSKFVRITWEEALDIAESELKRQYEKYGPGSILAQQDGHGETKAVHGPHGCQTKFLDMLGGCTVQARNPDSWEGWYWGAKHVWSEDPIGLGKQNNLFYDITQNTKMLLFWGGDPETTPWGWGGFMPSRMSFWFSEIGIKTVYICPDLNYGAAVHADKWIPVYPNTDLALQFAIAYVWITEDIYDKEYMATHSIGFEYLENHALGKDDGIPKTPEWAEPICGVPARVIKALARKWAKEATSTAHCNGGSYIRSCYSHEPARMEVCLLAMQGLGKPGRNQFRMIEWGHMGKLSNLPVPRSEVIPDIAGAYHGSRAYQYERFIPKDLIPQAIMCEDTIEWQGTTLMGFPREDQFITYQFPVYDDDPHIHMIWSDSPCWTTCWNGGNNFIDALRNDKVDFVMIQHPWLENDCLFADLLLPVNTRYEEEDIGVDIFNGDCNQLFYEGQCIEPLGESKSDWEIVCAIAERFGMLQQYTGGDDVASSIRKGFEQSGVADRMTYEEFREKEYYIVPIADNWENDPPGFSLFYKDPENNPLQTPSGKLEIYSAELAEYFPDDDERRPYPHWIPYGESHQESRLHARSEEYPYLMVSNHPRWRVHANMDDISWLREIRTCKVTGPDDYQYEPIWINPIDAGQLGVQDGDIVKIYNDRGWVLGGLYVTERIREGAVLQDHGARLDPIVPGESDRSGSNNLICPTMVSSKNAIGEVTSGYLVGVEKVDVFELAKQYPEAFGRKYEKGVGVCINNRIKEGK